MIEQLENVMRILVERDQQRKPLKADDRISSAIYMLHTIILQLYDMHNEQLDTIDTSEE